MNCTEINVKMADLFDESISQEAKDEIFIHFKECPDCRKSYDEMQVVIAELKPRVKINASSGLKANILNQAIRSGARFQSRRIRVLPKLTPAWKKITAIAALLALLFILFPVVNRPGWFQNKANAANTLLENSIHALAGLRSVYMEFKVRTLEGDNFDYINVNEGFVEHKIWKVFGEQSKWRIEKPSRTVVMDGKHQYMYSSQAGTALKGNADAGFVGWMSILLDPGNILAKEKENARLNGSKFKVEEDGNTITLTVNAKAMGVYQNSFMLNTSIPESNNRRVYTFDKSSKLLQSFKVYVSTAGKEIEVLELTTLKYNEPVEDAVFTLKLPEKMDWVAYTDVINGTGISGITSQEVAKHFFTACHNEDWDAVKPLIPGFLNFLEFQFVVKAEYGGLTIISIGKSSKSGQYPGEFVPYEFRLKSGKVKKMNLALRNDNKDKKWIVDGGF